MENFCSRCKYAANVSSLACSTDPRKWLDCVSDVQKEETKIIVSSLDEARGQAKEETRPVELPFPSLIIITWLRDRSRERNRLKGVRFLVDEVIDHRDR